MTCDERQDLLLLYAGDLLEPAERDALRDHLLSGCPACAGALAEAEATLALMAASVVPVAPPAAAWDKLSMRIGQGTKTLTSPRVGRPIVAVILAAAAAVAITSGAWLYGTRDARLLWRSRNLTTIAMTSPTQPGARGQVWWDRDRNAWRVTVAGLCSAPVGREYELWFIPKGAAPIRSRTFRADADGAAMVIVPVPSTVGALATAAITDEPIGGSDAPTGTIQLAGQFQ